MKNPFWRNPDRVIGSKNNPYLLRWHVIPRNQWFNIYLHKFIRDDDDRAFHDHPWWFVSLMLAGRYIEYFEKIVLNLPIIKKSVRRFGSIVIRSATHKHRIELFKLDNGSPIPCWTLVVSGPRIRDWGFWCPKGFVHWKEFENNGCD